MLIDTNVLLDAALERQPHFGSAVELLNRLIQEPERAFIAWHTVSNFYYLVVQALGRERARSLVTELTEFLGVAETDTESLRYALSLPMADFEDAMQVAAAHAAGVQQIVTRNLRDFTQSPIPAITPEQALRELF